MTGLVDADNNRYADSIDCIAACNAERLQREAERRVLFYSPSPFESTASPCGGKQSRCQQQRGIRDGDQRSRWTWSCRFGVTQCCPCLRLS